MTLRVGDRLRVGPAVLEVVQIGKPPEIAHTYNFKGVSVLPRKGIFCRVVQAAMCRGAISLRLSLRNRRDSCSR
jgi:MOSC domain-containing protein YiiM